MKRKLCLIISACSLLAVGCSQAEFNPSKPRDIQRDEADDTPSLEKSSMDVSLPNVADGITPTYVTLTLRNKRGEFLKGKTPSLSLGGVNNVLVPCTVSDQNGKSRCTLYSTKSEMKWVKIQTGVEMNGEILFTRAPASTTLNSIVSTGDVQKTLSQHTIIASAGTIESAQIINNENNQKLAHLSHLSTMSDD